MYLYPALVGWLVLTLLLFARSEFYRNKRKRAEAIVKELVRFPGEYPDGDYANFQWMAAREGYRFILCCPQNRECQGTIFYWIMAQPLSELEPNKFRVRDGRIVQAPDK